MFLIITIVQSFLLFIAYAINRKEWFKWILIENVWWIFLLLMIQVSPYEAYKISDHTYILVWLYLLFVTVGFCFHFKGKKVKPFNKEEKDSCFEQIFLKNKFVRVLMWVFFFCLSYYAIQYGKYINSMGVLYARTARFYVGGIFHSTLELLIFNYIISAGRFLFIFIIAYSVINQKMKSIVFLLAITNLLLYSFIGGSRFPVVMLGVEILILWILCSQYKKKSMEFHKIKYKTIRKIGLIIGCIVGIIICMLFFTAYRLGMTKFDMSMMKKSIDDLYEQCIGYNIGPVAALNTTYKKGILTNHFYFGRAVIFNGLDELIANIGSFLGINISSARYTLGELMAKPIMLDSSREFNALYTCIFWFYSDLGVVGVILYSFIFGLCISQIIRYYHNRPNIWTLMLVSHVLYFFIMSNFTWEINTMDSLIYIFFIYLYVKKKERKLNLIE